MDLPAGLSARALNAHDVEAVWEIIRANERLTTTPLVTIVTDVAKEFDEPHQVLASDTLGLVDDSGVLVAYFWTSLNPVPTRRRVVRVHGRVDPAWHRRGVGGAIIEWGTERALARLAEAPDDLPTSIETEVYEEDIGALRAFESKGFSIERYWVEMTRDLSTPIEVAPLANDLNIVPWAPDWDDEIRRTHNEAFRDHWGSEPLSEERWNRWLSGHESFLPDVSFLVRHDEHGTVGYVMNFAYPHEWEDLGHSEGWINGIGTLPQWRGRGIASALIARSLASFREAEFDHAALGVDADNPTGALGLYERHGFVTTRRELTLSAPTVGD